MRVMREFFSGFSGAFAPWFLSKRPARQGRAGRILGGVARFGIKSVAVLGVLCVIAGLAFLSERVFVEVMPKAGEAGAQKEKGSAIALDEVLKWDGDAAPREWKAIVLHHSA